MTWVSLTNSLGLVYNMVMYGILPNVNVMPHGEESSVRLRFRDGSVSLQLIPLRVWSLSSLAF